MTTTPEAAKAAKCPTCNGVTCNHAISYIDKTHNKVLTYQAAHAIDCPFCLRNKIASLEAECERLKKLTGDALGGPVSSFDLLLSSERAAHESKRSAERRADTDERELAELKARQGLGERPTIVCLCGSTRFMEAFQAANLKETLAGRIVLSVGCNTKSDAGLGISLEVKEALDRLHKQKIDLADEVLVLNVGGYIGDSTRSEIEHAKKTGKPIRYLESLLAKVEGT